jgi:hypothetical protein
MDRSGRGAGRILLDAEEELRADQHAFQRSLDTEVEIAFGAAGFVEASRAAEIVGRDVATIRAAQERRQDAVRARGLFGVGALPRASITNRRVLP